LARIRAAADEHGKPVPRNTPERTTQLNRERHIMARQPGTAATGGKILCTGGCLSFWFRVLVTAGTGLRAPASVTGKLGTIRRPGGMTRLTINGRPLCTFRLDHAAPEQDCPGRRQRQ
jgi:hypothetical protein